MRQLTPFALCFGFAIYAGSGTLSSAGAQTGSDEDVEMSGISGSVEKPRRHFRLKNPAFLKPQRASEVYSIISDALKRGYSRTDREVAARYQGWKKFNSAPYRSVTHGNHYLNNYANDIARQYAKFEGAGAFPVGSIIAKDSFAVTETGGILLGGLFVMQKMPEGFSYASGDWKYMLIGPDGTFYGETNGAGSDRVEYCISCHLAVEHQDHLFFIPPAYRKAE